MQKIADMLTEESVSILTINDDGLKHRCAYMNSASDRELLVANEPVEIVAEVFKIWGDEPTYEEPSYDNIPEVQPKDSWDEMAEAIKQGVNEV